MPSVSILIVNWNSKDYLRRCLQTISSTASELDPQVVVVDGGSFDGCKAMLAAEFPAAEFIQSSHNLGFGRSNNLGFKSVNNEYLLLLNPDTELQPRALSEFLAIAPSLPQWGIAGARLLNSDGTLQETSVRSLPTPLNRAFASKFLSKNRFLPWFSSSARALRSHAPTEVQAVSGACMFMRTSLFRAVGGFSPEYFMYAEDMDLCAKVRNSGLRNYYIPSATVVHHGGGSSKTTPSEFSILTMRSAWDIYMKKNLGSMAALRYRILQLSTAIVRLALLYTTLPFLPQSRKTYYYSSITKWLTVVKWAAYRLAPPKPLAPLGPPRP